MEGYMFNELYMDYMLVVNGVDCENSVSTPMKVENKNYHLKTWRGDWYIRNYKSCKIYLGKYECSEDRVPRKKGKKNNKPKYVEKIEDLDGEIWKEVDNTDGYYFVSNKGRVKSLKRKGREVLLTPLYSMGYYRVRIFYLLDEYNKESRSKGVHEYIHKLVANAFLSKPSDFSVIPYVVDHIDRDKLNNNLDNLRYVTRSDNSRNKDIEDIDYDKIVEMISIYKSGSMSLTELCRYSGYKYSTVENLLKGKSRPYLQDKANEEREGD